MLARFLGLVAALAAALLLAGCGGMDDEPPVGTTATGTTSTETETTGSTTATIPTGLEGASTDPAVLKGTGDEVALLTDIRAARHGGYDRVVFEFRNVAPGYDVRYVQKPVRADASGEEVPVKGGAVLLVRMEPALDADLTQESAPRTYLGPQRFTPDATVIEELVRTGGFEAVLTWAVGVDEKRPFKVTRLEDPARIVIDIAS
jgi:hypothetical protein